MSAEALQTESSPPIEVTEWRLEVGDFNGRSDLFVDVIYSYNFTDDERLTQATLYLSLDNESFVQAQKHEFDPALMDPVGSGGFYFANAAGDPLPFDVYQGDILYGYVEFTTTTEMYTSPYAANEIPIDVIRPFLFRIPAELYLIGGLVASILPIAIIAYCVTRKRRK
ncbi:MAG: hypothetical protein ACFFD6_03490 [Candidatus Thorarchaeota archaeon]